MERSGAGAVQCPVQPNRPDRDHALIGIVKKNAIMMVDFALEAHGTVTSRRRKLFSRPVCCVFADYDDYPGGAVWRAAAGVVGGDGSELRQPLGITIVGGLVIASF